LALLPPLAAVARRLDGCQVEHRAERSG
jgi:hypothetical protein